MPEEYKIWKEKVEALEQGKHQPAPSVAQPVATQASPVHTVTLPQPQPEVVQKSRVQVTRAESATPSQKPTAQAKSAEPEAQPEEKPVPKYNSKEEAEEAFKQMLNDLGVPSTFKWKEVIDMCSKDERWEAFRTTGQKKQALAEYQTAKSKQEKVSCAYLTQHPVL
jgi:pre-mRNA-processing factor 40